MDKANNGTSINNSDNSSTEHKNKEHVKDEAMDLDELLPQVGEFGKYQKLLIWLVCLPACIPCGFCAFNQLFMAEVPEHWCKNTELDINGVTQHIRRNLAIPKVSNNSNTYANCQRYAVNFTQLLENTSILNLKPNSSWPIESCKEGWEYDTTDISSSIVIDFELVCDRSIYPTLGLVSLSTGGPIGVYAFGVLNDRIGRKKSFFLCLSVLIFGGLSTALSTNFWTWAISRFIVGLTVPAIYQIPFIIALELVGPNYRSFVTVLTCIFYTLGLILLAGITYLIRSWVYLSYVTSLPFILMFIYWWFLPESPRWLLAKGRFEESYEILQTLARVNNKPIPDSFKLKLKQHMSLHRTKSEEQKLQKGLGVMSLFRTPNMRLKTILITLNWFANEMVYVGLSYYGPSLGKDRYFSFFLSSLVEIPSYLCCWAVMDRWGRRWPLTICMVLSGFSCIITVLLPEDAVITTLVLYLFSKFTISASFLIIYPFAGELYPTQIRGIGIGASAYISGLGLIIIPFIVYLGSEMLVLPLVIMGVVSVIGGICGLRLPETLHHKLPQTIEEGEEFGKDWTIKDCLQCIPTEWLVKFGIIETNNNNDNKGIEQIEQLFAKIGVLDKLYYDNKKNNKNYNSITPIEINHIMSPSAAHSYEDLAETSFNELETTENEEIKEENNSLDENTPLSRQSTMSIKRPTRSRRLVRQSSILETPFDASGAMKMTYWY